MAPHSSTLAWKIPWTEKPGGLQSMGSLRVGHDWATSLSCIGEGNGKPLQCSCLENPRDREPGGLPSMGSYRVEHDRSNLALAAWRPKRPFRTKTQKRCPFDYRGLECKCRMSRNTWTNEKIWPWNMEWSRAKANRVFPRECTGHSKYLLLTTQEKTLHMDITRWSTPKSDWLYALQPKMEKLYTISKRKTGRWLWLRSWTPFCQIQT